MDAPAKIFRPLIFLCAALVLALLLTPPAFSQHAFRPIATPPTHVGTLLGLPGCNTTYEMAGYEPDDNETHPLFLMLGGTTFGSGGGSAPFQIAEMIDPMLQALAERGFVAVVAEYDDQFNSLTWNEIGFFNKLDCMFDHGSSESLINKVCGLDSVDCSKGISISGHSQGGFLLLGASQYEPRIRSALVTGHLDYDHKYSALPFNRVRYVIGQNEPDASLQKLNEASDMDCSDTANDCVRADGSGWLLVREEQVAPDNEAGHCWFFKKNCLNAEFFIEPNWWNPNSPPTYPFSLLTGADWIAETHEKSQVCPSQYVALKSTANNKYVSARLWTAGVPVQASAQLVLPWEVFACYERDNGQIALRADNGQYLVAESGNGFALSATLAQPNSNATFTYIDLGNNQIALQGNSGFYIGIDTNQNGLLKMDRAAISATETFEVIIP